MDYGDKLAAAKRSLFTPPRWSLFTPPLTDSLVRDLDRPQSGVIEMDNARITLLTPVRGDVGPAFRAAGVALPLNIAETPTT